MPAIRTSEAFEKYFSKLPAEVRKKASKAIRLLAINPKHPSLQAKPVQGAAGLYEARVDLAYRITYERLPGDVLLLRVIGKHDETLKNP